MSYKVSVIIPVYKAESYIARCAQSLFEQTLDSIEFIFVNDCSPDRSMEVLNSVISNYPERKDDVKIIDHLKNAGVARSRQDGLDAATGEFVIHCDPDDRVELSAYKAMYETAVKENADIVICDFYKDSKSHTVVEQQNIPPSCTGTELITAICSGKIFGACWNKLVRRETIIKSQAHFVENLNVCEDLFFTVMVLKSRPKICYLNRALYHYDIAINPNSLQRSKQKNHTEYDKRIISLASTLLSGEGYRVARESLITQALFSIFTSDVYSDRDFSSNYSQFKSLPFTNRGYVSRIDRLLLQLALNGSAKRALAIYDLQIRVKARLKKLLRI